MTPSGVEQPFVTRSEERRAGENDRFRLSRCEEKEDSGSSSETLVGNTKTPSGVEQDAHCRLLCEQAAVNQTMTRSGFEQSARRSNWTTSRCEPDDDAFGR